MSNVLFPIFKIQALKKEKEPFWIGKDVMFRLFEQSTQSFWRRGNSTFLRLSLFFVYSLFVLFYFPTQKNIELRLCLITAGCNPRTFCRRKRISYIVFLLIFLVKLNEAKTNYCTERFILRRSCYNFF